MIQECVKFIETTLENRSLLLIITCLSLFLKSMILGRLFVNKSESVALKKATTLLMLVLVGSLLADCSWIIPLSQILFFSSWTYPFVIFCVRIGWIAYLVQCQSLALLLSMLTIKEYQFKTMDLFQKLLAAVSGLLALVCTGIIIFDINCQSELHRSAFELNIIQSIAVYSWLLLLLALMFAVRKLHSTQVPKILRKQIIMFCQGIGLFIVCEIIQTPFSFESMITSFAIASLSTILLTLVLYFAVRKIVKLRFFNADQRVRSAPRAAFTLQMKRVSEQLNDTTILAELAHITKMFFKEVFSLSTSCVQLCIRSQKRLGVEGPVVPDSIEHHIENFLHTSDDTMMSFIKKLQILNRDELVFTDFYELSEHRTRIITVMTSAGIDLFLPIYQGRVIVAYITVNRTARSKNELYPDVECNEMMVFAVFLGSIINILKNRDLELIVGERKELKEELYFKQQEMSQYQESMRSFLRGTEGRRTGIIFYKNHRFTFGNQVAHEMINFDIHKQKGHPLACALLHIAQSVEKYKSTQTCMVPDKNGDKIVMSAMPGLDRNNVIITICPPEVSDLIKRQVPLLKDPRKWDYLLYLETTQSGSLINALLPGSSKTLINAKINLLETALSKKATFLQVPVDDLTSTVELIHAISLRDTLYSLVLKSPEKGASVLVNLFGVGALLGGSQRIPVLQKLNIGGTLFIENIHFLSMKTQEHLVEYIKYGYFRPFQGSGKIPSDVRIICSSNCDLRKMVSEEKFSKELYDELKKMSLSMPQLLLLSQEELHEVADEMTTQLVKHGELRDLLELTEREKSKIVKARPASLRALRNQIARFVSEKSKKNNIQYDVNEELAFTTMDPVIKQASLLGKHALRDEKLMRELWEKFKCQSQIADLLKVNRSSVHKRCKEYNISKETTVN